MTVKEITEKAMTEFGMPAPPPRKAESVFDPMIESILQTIDDGRKIAEIANQMLRRSSGYRNVKAEEAFVTALNNLIGECVSGVSCDPLGMVILENK